MDQRFITPTRLIAGRFNDEADIPQWDAAVICFRDMKGSQAIIQALGGLPVGRKVFWGMEETEELPYVYTAEVDGRRVGIAGRCIWGGPQAAILVEELSAMGVKCIIGYGAAGSLDPSLGHGSQLVISSALATDGTSRQYSDGPFHPDEDMAALVPSASHVVAATVDAVYRETPQLVEHYTQIGAQVVNMEAAPFYAAASACGLRAVWVGHVSDVLLGDWKDWYVDRAIMNDGAIENCLAVIRGVPIKDEQAAEGDAANRAP